MELDEYAQRCFDDRCECKTDCPLWTDRDNPKARIKAMTLRHGNECHDEQCRKAKEILNGYL